MTIVAPTATLSLASRSTSPPASQAKTGGIGLSSNTESSTIFSGHGEASPIAVSRSIATTTMASHFQYGRTSRAAKRSITDHGTRENRWLAGTPAPPVHSFIPFSAMIEGDEGRPPLVHAGLRCGRVALWHRRPRSDVAG